MEARMKIEEKIRKERRVKQQEDMRKPILTTPWAKRGRQEEEKWEDSCMEARKTPAAQLGRGLKLDRLQSMSTESPKHVMSRDK